MKLDHLLNSAETFEKLAAFDFAAICKNYGRAIQSEVAAAIQNINKLVTTNRQAANSKGIQALDDILGKISDAARNLEPQSADIAIRYMKAYIGSASFYTSSINAGTGYDPATRTGGAWSPAAFLNRINTYVDKLDNYNQLYKKEVESTKQTPDFEV